jgi:predicted nucleic acid-binding Zn ribbon protein
MKNVDKLMMILAPDISTAEDTRRIADHIGAPKRKHKKASWVIMWTVLALLLLVIVVL